MEGKLAHITAPEKGKMSVNWIIATEKFQVLTELYGGKCLVSSLALANESSTAHVLVHKTSQFSSPFTPPFTVGLQVK